MFTFCIVIIIIAAILMVLVVLVQNSKGGGLASGFASGNQVMGAPKTADFLEKVTWSLAAIIIVFSIIGVGANKHVFSSSEDTDGSAITDQVHRAVEDLQQQQSLPAFGEETPTTTPSDEAQ